MFTPQDIEDYLRPLVGLALSAARRAADMRTFQFGPLCQVENGSVGDYALHIQCPWRIEGPEGIVTGRSDLWEPDTVTAALWVAGLGFAVPVATMFYFVGAMNAPGYPASRGKYFCGLTFLVLVLAQASALLLGRKASRSRTIRVVMLLIALPLLFWAVESVAAFIWQVNTGGLVD